MDDVVSVVVHSQLTASPPSSVRVTSVPSHTEVPGSALMLQPGLGLTVISLLQLAVHPLASVMVTLMVAVPADPASQVTELVP